MFGPPEWQLALPVTESRKREKCMMAFDWIASHSERTPYKLAIIDHASQRQFSYRQLHDRVGALAAFLQHTYQVTKSDRVAILSANCIEIFELQFACARIGAIFVPLNIRLANAELNFMLSDLEAKVLICDQELLSTGIQLARALPVALITMGLNAQASQYDQGISSYRDQAIFDNDDMTLDDPLAILFTSGTTGKPKGAILTHGMVLNHAVNIIGPARLTHHSVNLSFLPLFHTSGLNVYANPCFLLGATTIVLRKVRP